MGANYGPLRTPRRPKAILSNVSASGQTVGAIQMLEASGYSKWAFQVIPHTVGTAVSGWSVMLYGTLDPNAVNDDGITANPNYPLPGSTGGAWFPIPSPSEQSGTGTVANPLTDITQVLESKIPLVAVVAVATGTSPTGAIDVVSWAVD